MSAGARSAPARTAVGVEARGVRFSYGTEPLFDGIDLRLDPSERVALIGPNGSGKTTLLKLLAGTLRASGGEVFLDGRTQSELAPRERARLVGVVPQDVTMTFDFTVMETVLMGRIPYLGFFGLEGPEDVAAAEEAMRRTGTLPFASRLLSRLSGGERQLVLIARAMAQNPRVLLLDEPTAFLDIRHRLEIYELLCRLNDEEGITVLTTSHDINLVARYCTRIVLVKAGRIRADGPPREVFQPDILSDIYETPLKVSIEPESGMPFAVPQAPPPARR